MYRHPQPNSGLIFGNAYGRRGERIAEPEEIGTPQEDQQSQVWTLWAEPPTKEHSWASPRSPCTHGADEHLELHVDPKKLEWGLSQKLLPICGICSSWAVLSVLSRERKHLASQRREMLG